ncbi:MAG: hypothetical protein ACSLE9_08575, partial [Burkholderiaceae bacterium]
AHGQQEALLVGGHRAVQAGEIDPVDSRITSTVCLGVQVSAAPSPLPPQAVDATLPKPAAKEAPSPPR